MATTTTVSAQLIKYFANGDQTIVNLKTSGAGVSITRASGAKYPTTVTNMQELADALGSLAFSNGYSNATTSAAGLMSSSDKSKLDGIASGANKYSHPTYTAKSSGFYKVTVDGTGHVSATTAVAKSDITALGISASDHTHNYAGSSSAGGSATSAVKLDTSSAGSATQPVYFSGGKPVACTYTLGKSVPSNAVFTDTNTWRGIQNNLTSDSTSDSLSAAQGKILKGLVDGKLAKTTYEYNKELAIGSSGKVCIGKFPCYDSNISVEIKSTTNTTYNGTLIIATQNINTSLGGVYKCVVYGDENNTLTSSIQIGYVSGSNVFSVYINLPPWSKNILHIQCVSLAGSPTDIATIVDSIPSTATIIPINAFTHSHNSVNDINGSATTTFAYSKAGLGYSDYSWLAAWNGYELRAVSKSQFATASHTHSYAGSSSAGGAANSVANSMVVKLNGGSTEGTNLFTFNGSSGKTVNITPSAIGAAASSHGTHVSYSSDAPKANGTAAAGSSGAVARADHVHPLQTSVSGSSGSCTGNAATATKATQDSAGQQINTTYIKGLSVSGRTITYTKGDGSTGTITTQDTNTTYGVFGAATSSAAGSNGLVPAPAKGAQGLYLRGDGTWATPTNTTYGVATTSANGLMSSSDKSKLDGIASGANNYSHPNSGVSAGTYRSVAVNAQGHVTGGSNPTTLSGYGITDAAAKSHTHGNADITALDAGKITSGVISIDRLPQGALERCVVVADDTARFKLTSSNVQVGDTVKVTSTGKMYFVVDASKLNAEAGYEVYTAGSATSVPWSGVTGKPSTFTPSSHTHNYAGSSSAGGSATSAVKLDTSSAGSATQPVYFSGGKPVACTYTLGKSVPSNAVFTDTNTWRPLGTTADTACAGNDSRLSNARPASDVYAWAKASSKPSYSWSEITGKPSTFTPASHTHNYAGSSSAGGAANSANRIVVIDTRNDNPAPNSSSYAKNALSTDFKYVSKIGSPSGFGGTYCGLISFAPWSETSGGNGYQIAVGYNSNAHPRLAVRSADLSATSWGSWYKIYTSDDKPTLSELGAAAASHTHSYAGSSSAGGAANNAVKDSAGQQINTTYIKGLSVSGRTITYTRGDGTTGTITTQDTNTTYPVATQSANGLMSTADKKKVDNMADLGGLYVSSSTPSSACLWAKVIS